MFGSLPDLVWVLKNGLLIGGAGLAAAIGYRLYRTQGVLLGLMSETGARSAQGLQNLHRWQLLALTGLGVAAILVQVPSALRGAPGVVPVMPMPSDAILSLLTGGHTFYLGGRLLFKKRPDRGGNDGQLG